VTSASSVVKNFTQGSQIFDLKLEKTCSFFLKIEEQFYKLCPLCVFLVFFCVKKNISHGINLKVLKNFQKFHAKPAKIFRKARKGKSRTFDLRGKT
jgi:hypothetical protein